MGPKISDGMYQGDLELDTHSSNLENRPDAPLDQQRQSFAHFDASEALTALPKKKSFSFYMSILLLGLVSLLVTLDATTLAVALPVIAKELHGTTLESFWASISFTLAVAVTQPIYSSVSDVIGRKLPLYIAMILFTVGSITFAAAKSMSIVILGRLLQGFGGGGMDVLQVIILSDLTALRERSLYMGVNAIFYASGAVSGPILGGVFSEYVTWRWLGWINLPILGICFVLTFFFLHLKPIDMELRAKLRRLDWIGMLLFATGATAMALPLSWADTLFSWSSWQTILPLVIGIILLAGLAFYERRPAEPVLPYRIFNNITIVAAMVSGFAHGLLMYTIVQYIPLFYQAVYLQTPLDAALSTLPYTGLLVLFSSISGVVVNFLRRYRLVLWLGWLLSTTFLGLLYLLDRNTSKAEAYIFQVFTGVGIGTVLTVIAIPTQASVKHVDDTGLAAGMLVIFRFFGALVGLTVASTIFTSVFQHRISAFATLPESLKVLEGASQAISFIPSLRTIDLPQETMGIVIGVYRGAFQAIWIAMTCVSGIGFLASLFIKELTLEKDDIGRQGFQQPS